MPNKAARRFGGQPRAEDPAVSTGAPPLSHRDRSMALSIGAIWFAGGTLIVAAAVTRPAEALPAFAQQTGQPCKTCHVGGFGPELTPFGREFKIGGYTLRAKPSVPIAAMAIASVTHTRKDQVPAPEHLSRNDNLVLDQASLFLAGGVGQHLGGFAQVTYDGVAKAWSWDNLDLRAVTKSRVFGKDAVFGLSLNNNPTVQDPWNTLPAWGFPFTDTAVSQTPAAAPLIDGALAQSVFGLSGYAWLDHKAYLEVGGYTSPSAGTLRWLGADPSNPGSIHGIAPYGRVAYQTKLGGGTFEVGASALKASLFPARIRSSGFADHYTDLGFDTSWQKTLGPHDSLSFNLRYEHERADLRASCALALIGDGSDIGCGRYDLNEWRAAIRYTIHDKIGLTLSPFSLTGSRNANVFQGNGLPDSNGIMGQIDYTLWPASNSPLGSRFNARIGLQYTLYGKFNGARHNFDGNGGNASDNNAIRLFTWIAF
jgi:hypothetical protein